MTLHHHPQSPLLDHCPEGLPAHAYYDAAWYAAEQKAVWAIEDHLARMLESEKLVYSEIEFSQIKKELEEFVATHVDADFA